MVCLGDELGLYEAMAGAGPMTAAQLAPGDGDERAGSSRSGSTSQAAAGLRVGYDAAAGTLRAVPPSRPLALADERCPAFVAGGI